MRFARATALGFCLVILVALSTGGSCSPEGVSGTPEAIFDNGNIGLVVNNPTASTVVTLDQEYKITLIRTYHWNNGLGTAAPGTIGLRSSGGNLYGPYAATGSAGQGEVANALWNATPDAILPAGVYTVVDSDPATWSCNADSGNAGIAYIEGIPTQAGALSPARKVELYNDFNTAAADFGQKHFNFVKALQTWQETPITDANMEEALTAVNEFISAGEAWVSAADTLNGIAAALEGGSDTSKPMTRTAQGLPVPGAPIGPSPGMIRNLGNEIGGARNDVNQSMANNPNYATDPDQAARLKDDLANTATQRGRNVLRTGVTAVAGIGGSVVSGGTAYVLLTAGAITVSAPAALVIGGAAVIGGGIASAVTWWWTAPETSCSGGAQRTMKDGAVCSFAAGSIGAGKPIPNVFPEAGGTFTITIPGYLPISITNFQPPGAGKQLNINPVLVPVTEENMGEQVAVSFEEVTASGTTAEDVVSISAVPSPMDPGPGDGVTVTATIFPVIEGISVLYSVTGSDGYSASGTPTTNADGQISFYIPGGATDVHDVIRINVGELSTTVSYTF